MVLNKDPLEIFANILNGKFFFREFTHSDNKLKQKNGDEYELADSVIYIKNILIIFQIKRRENQTYDIEKEDNWYDNKVIGLAKKQIRDTLDYLDKNPIAKVINQYGYETQIDYSKVEKVFKVIVFDNDNLSYQKQERIYDSRNSGLIHIFEISDYQDIFTTLLTPQEFIEYLEFREGLYRNHGQLINRVLERALLGQFILGNFEDKPNETYMLAYFTLNREEIDIIDLIRSLSEHHVDSDSYSSITDFYAVLQEFALMNRAHFRRLSKLHKNCFEHMQKTENSPLWNRIHFGDLDLGVLFVVTNKESIDERRKFLEGLFLLAKYSMKVSKQIGVMYKKESGGNILIEWMYLDHEWVMDEQIDELLSNNNPFGELKGKPEHYFDLS